jgi:signal peptidase I
MGEARRKRQGPGATRPRRIQRGRLATRTRAFLTGVLPVVAIVLVTRETLAEAYRIPSASMEPTLVKRIVAMAGDTILMRHGQLVVNGSAMPSPDRFTLPDSLADEPQPLFAWEHRIEISGSRFGPAVAAPSLHEWGPLVIPAGTYFMMGDNRDDSVDSRYYGLVPRANLRGTPMFVYYSYDPERSLDYVRAVTAIRWGRLGTWIH